MAKKKESKEEVSKDEDQLVPETSISEVEKVSYDPDKINSEEEAINHVRQNYKIPETIKTVFVTEDKNVFYRANPAKTHASQNNLKLFAIKWQA